MTKCDDELSLLHNGETVGFEQFCIRDERSAQTMAVLSSKPPDSEHARAFLAVNRPLTRDDPLRVAPRRRPKTCW